ncbi:MAG: ABC transporter ATP-binding protein, partial [Actinomycetota bacterium]|nr:ABC transporter ATP-binding protein [Actinomycetota bacterium]
AAALSRLGVREMVEGPTQVHGLLGSVQPEAIVAALVHAGVGVAGFAVTTPSLEDLFVGLTGEGFDVSG